MYRVSIEFLKHEWKFGRTRNALGTRAAGECFHSFFEFSQTFAIKNPCFIRVYNIKRRVLLFSPHYLSNVLLKTAKTHFLWRNLWLSSLRSSRKFWRRGMKHSSVIKLRQFVLFLLYSWRIKSISYSTWRSRVSHCDKTFRTFQGTCVMWKTLSCGSCFLHFRRVTV